MQQINDNQEIHNITNIFPNIKLSYENVLHKKVSYYNYSMYSIIPDGEKCFIWFNEYNNINVCFLLTLTIISSSYKIKSINIINCCFSNELVFGSGSIIFGTLTQTKNNQYIFILEDIHLYKGKFISKYTWGDKLDYFNNILSIDINQQFNSIIFGLPIIKTSYKDILYEINNLTCYTIKYIQLRNYNNNCVSYNECINNINKNFQDTRQQSVLMHQKNTNIQQPNTTNIQKPNTTNHKETILLIEPTITNDIYNIYCYNNTTQKPDKFCGVALINNYKTSVMMNKLFRNIKENTNIDLIEESDEESDFENSCDSKYLLNKTYLMKCNYNKKFKKWLPIKLADNYSKITNYNTIKTIC